MKITKCTIPADSLARNYLPADYTDAFVCEVDPAKRIDPDSAAVCFWTDLPGWITFLVRVRNFAAGIVGLKGSELGDAGEFEKCIRTGGRYGFVSVPAKNGNETLLLLSDKHLDARLSVMIGGNGVRGTISAITLVHYKNTLGRVYFFIIRPFHGLVVKSMLKRVAARAENGSSDRR